MSAPRVSLSVHLQVSFSLISPYETRDANLVSTDWMNNFIVGQVTPDMLRHITYGTFIFFGLITTLGALFIAFLVPETMQLSLGKC